MTQNSNSAKSNGANLNGASSTSAADPDRILPELHHIQEKHGYLNREALERASRNRGIPLYRYQEVASFFPHFRLAPESTVTVLVCRDMACNLAGAASIIEQLKASSGEGVHVEGVSCLGRCDRAPASNIAICQEPPKGSVGELWQERELYCMGRGAEELKQIIKSCARIETAPKQIDLDVDQSRYPSDDWVINPYKGRTPNYQAVRDFVAARDGHLRQASQQIMAELGLPPEKQAEIIETLRSLKNANSETARSAPEEVVNAVLTEFDEAHASLRGLGGAGVPASQKWRDVRNSVARARQRHNDDRAFIVVNADESEPATFKDRELLLHYPHLIVESVIMAGLVTDATEGFIYIRHEYPEQIEACRAEIRRAEAQGVCGAVAPVLGRPFPVSVFISPGGYICGEQSALIEAMSGRRGEPRNMPPALETNGLNDLPTLVSNVETYAWVPYILLNGGKQYASLGVNGWKGRRFFSVCGDVNRPGVYEVPMGLTLRELIYGPQYCQGVLGGRKLKAFAPSGPSGGFLPARLTAASGLPRRHTENKAWQELAARRGFDPASQELDILDLELELNLFRALSPTSMLGAGLAVYAEGRDIAEQTVNSLQFFRNESCGKCVPCRLGSQKMANLGTNLLAGRIDAATWKNEMMPLVEELSEVMGLTSICGLGRSVPIPIATLTRFFNEDLTRCLYNAETAR